MKKSFLILALLLVMGLVASEASALGWRRAARARAAVTTTYRTYDTYGTYYYGGSTVIDYDNYYYSEPAHGAVKYEGGHTWTYNTYTNRWVSEWFPVR